MRLLGRLRHPNICRLIDHSASTNPMFLAMELLDGETLSDMLQREGWLSTPKAILIVRQLASALEAAHRAGVVHRDFKPGNIMLCGDRVVVTDFGIARAERRFDDETEFTTTGGMAIGTPAYMAPEQIEGKPATAASDRYALGAVFYEMLSGQQPFGAQTPLKAIARKLRDEVTPLRLNLPNLDGRLDEAIPRCLARDPPDRFARAADLLPLLEGAGWRSWLPRAWTFLSTAASLCVWRFSPPA